ncbi:putative DNA modification/repair radical SAM protein [Halothermothrix orenii]|uniref:Radical SAM domain protein n=1 Tax=Halothermothrix orenii (strain H 168 / OCM 544 / DSM 9562) TaxID=373903 RepID=B8D232_HALOH|nr:putative DNA modification/repair radical SAM protein [Halothermothrix orenii]ACL69259.1 Radical SAM domain protein [Halothermothrix orenii H 168]
MEILQKIKILSAAARYDVSCSSSGSRRRNSPDGMGNTASGGICHSWSDDGRCISLLKILFTNYCIYDCAYCINRISNDIPRASFTPEEVARITVNFYKRNYIEGLFLSSAVHKNPDYTMERLVKTARLLRKDYKFNGYIHLKAIPGADLQLINEAGHYADRLSVNIELPTRKTLKKLAPQKKVENIVTPMKFIGKNIKTNKYERKKFRNAPSFVPAGQSTQLIVGASPEPDYTILKLSENLYKKYYLKRVYYSAYIPVAKHPRLPALKKPPLLREHRLYQADWLIRFYGFTSRELLTPEKPNLDTRFDPKVNWALNHFYLFPVEINTAPYETLLRVPGIGLKSARRIVKARKEAHLNYFNLSKLGVVLKRARFFITCKGKYYGGIPFEKDLIMDRLSGNDLSSTSVQLSLFTSGP